MDKMDIFGQNRTKWTDWDRSGQKGHLRTKRTFWDIYTHLYPFGTLPLDKHKIQPVHLGIISLFKFFYHGKVK